MSDDIAQLLYEGALAVQEGRQAEGQELLLQVIERDEQNELAWLWLSGAMEDPADQQVALENVLAINPDNRAAQSGLDWLRQRNGNLTQAAEGADWTPPPPRSEDDVDQLTCWQCGASLYSVAQFCWQCHAAVHCCNNCVFRAEPRCKELQGLTSTMSQVGRNECPWWRVAE
jgi:hypothetical protein